MPDEILEIIIVNPNGTVSFSKFSLKLRAKFYTGEVVILESVEAVIILLIAHSI